MEKKIALRRDDLLYPELSYKINGVILINPQFRQTVKKNRDLSLPEQKINFVHICSQN